VGVDFHAEDPAPRGKLNRIEIDFLDRPSLSSEEQDALFSLLDSFFEGLGQLMAIGGDMLEQQVIGGRMVPGYAGMFGQ